MEGQKTRGSNALALKSYEYLFHFKRRSNYNKVTNDIDNSTSLMKSTSLEIVNDVI